MLVFGHHIRQLNCFSSGKKGSFLWPDIANVNSDRRQGSLKAPEVLFLGFKSRGILEVSGFSECLLQQQVWLLGGKVVDAGGGADTEH